MRSANEYTYDDMGRMTSRSSSDQGKLLWREHYEYDDLGNLSKRIHFDAATGERKHFVMAYR